MASNKLRAANADQGEDMAVDMSPMIDMVFLLLIFFVVNSRLVVSIADDRVEVPIAPHSKKQESANGRIIVNILEDGTIVAENSEILENGEKVEEYVRQRFVEEKNKGYENQVALNLRGDRRSHFKASRIVMRAAAHAGVNQFKFSSLPSGK